MNNVGEQTQKKDFCKTAIIKVERKNGEQVYLNSARPFSETAGVNKYIYGAVDKKSRFGCCLKPAAPRKKEMIISGMDHHTMLRTYESH